MKMLQVFVCLVLVLNTGCSLRKEIGSKTRWHINGYTTKSCQGTKYQKELDHYKVIVDHAPVLIQLANDYDRLNFMTDFDFDADQNTSNNRDNYKKEKYKNALQATIYYAIVESKTHYFITYHVYHADDSWETSWRSLGNFFFGSSHENDGESIQIVVDKKSSSIVIVATQLHFSHFFYISTDLGVDINNLSKAGGLHFKHLTSSNLTIKNDRPYLFIEAGKHGIAGNINHIKEGLGSTAYTPGKEIIFRPYSVGHKDRFTWKPDKQKYTYKFKSIRKELWERYIDGHAIDNNGIMAGGFEMELQRDGQTFLYKELPRFYNSSSMSSVLIWKKDSGMMPFYFLQGKLFFDPARHYKKLLNMKHKSLDEWSECYPYNPYVPVEFPALNCN